MSICEAKDGVIITIYVKLNSPKFKIELDGNEIIVCSAKEPEQGKVNKEILKEFSRLLHVKVKLVSGATARRKILFAEGLGKGQAEQRLQTV